MRRGGYVQHQDRFCFGCCRDSILGLWHRHILFGGRLHSVTEECSHYMERGVSFLDWSQSKNDPSAHLNPSGNHLSLHPFDTFENILHLPILRRTQYRCILILVPVPNIGMHCKVLHIMRFQVVTSGGLGSAVTRCTCLNGNVTTCGIGFNSHHYRLRRRLFCLNLLVLVDTVTGLDVIFENVTH